jgi:hypothetical protein
MSEIMRKKINRVISVTLISINFALVTTASLGSDIPCNVKLEFDSNSKGSVANYVLSLQLKNTTGRQISGASVIYSDLNNEQLGNTMLVCSSILKNEVKPGSYGSCVGILQRVDGAFMNAFGSEKWTEIVNTQLAKLNAVKKCEVLGFSY